MNPYSPPAAPGPYAVAPYPAAAPIPQGAPAAVTELTIDLLRRTRPWVLFLAVLSFVGCGLMAVMGVVMVAAGFLASGSPDPIPKVIGLVYLPFALLYVYPGIKLWKYGSSIGRLVASRTPAELEAALAEQKSFWKYIGVVAAVVLVLYAVGIGVAILFGVVAAMKGQS
jgi:hypothetical protein